VLAVDGDAVMAEWMQRLLEQRDCEVRTAGDGRTAELVCQLWRPHIVLLDIALPDIDGLQLMRRLKECVPASLAIVVSGCATVARVVEALTSGAFSLLEKPVTPDRFAEVIDEARRLIAARAEAVPGSSRHESFGGMVSQCPAMRRVFDLVRATAPTDADVLIVGENGTGKELVASAVHELSPRRGQPFVRINCAAVPGELLESEFFGHCRGAFTGAQADRPGLFEQAHRGSVLLDEIGEMAPPLQIKLLRVLQDHEFRPVGGHTSVRADFRLICATNVDPAEAVRRGTLREDLYFRLNTITLALPPLRDRQGDIPLLARYFLEEYARRYGRPVRGFQQAAMQQLERHGWPGNVRELQHVVERAVILAAGPLIAAEELPDAVRTQQPRPSGGSMLPTCTLEDLERLAIVQALELTSWNKQATARILGIHRPTLYNKLRKYRLWRRGDRFWHGATQGSE
jgi:DNA-binding NtrC family response regulator